MSFDSRSVSCTRFSVSGDIPGLDEIRGAIRKKAFISMPGDAASGTVGPLDIMDAGFSMDPILDDYVAFNIRTDSRQVPGSLLKIRVREEIVRVVGANRFVSKSEKAEIKERVKERLLADALPVPSMKGVLWSLGTNELWYEGKSEKQCDAFAEYFREMFPGITLSRLSASLQAIDFFPDMADDINSLEKTFGGGDAVDVDEVLSADFMTWLWYKTCNEGLGIDHDGTRYEITSENAVALKNGNGTLTISSKDENEDFSEVRRSLSGAGRCVTRLALVYEDDGGQQWRASLGAGSVAPLGVKKPAIKHEKDEDDVAGLLVEIDLLTKLWHAHDAVFRDFLETRLDKGRWDGVAKDVVSWSES